MKKLIFCFFFSSYFIAPRTLGGRPRGVNPFCIMVIIHITCCEGCKRFIVQAVWRSCTGFDDVAFVKFEFNFTGYIFLSGFNECLDCLTKWCEPFSFVNNLSKLAAKFLLGFHCVTVKDQFFQAVRELPSRIVPPGVSYTPRDFIPTTRFSTISTIPIPFSPPRLVQFCDDLGNLHCFSVECFRNTLPQMSW